jgi:hypothetical protein
MLGYRVLSNQAGLDRGKKMKNNEKTFGSNAVRSVVSVEEAVQDGVEMAGMMNITEAKKREESEAA